MGGGAHTIAWGLKSEHGAEPPGPLTLTTASRHGVVRKSQKEIQFSVDLQIRHHYAGCIILSPVPS